MKTLFYFLFLIILSSCSLGVYSQIAITPNVGSAGIITTVGGSGIVVSNVTISCNNNSYGTFSNGNSAGLGLGTGLLLSTGLTSEINSNGTNQNDDFDYDVGTTSTDPLLVGLIGAGIDIYDPCIIEFDIVPQCGTITLTFVFGSDEYTNWVSQGFNDGFGFFVTGPNPAGGNYTNTNVATLPSGTVVSIDNVNSTSNPTFFTNNNSGTAANHLDGFTTVITPIINVIPCQTYHFKLAIADAGDAQVDSAVLIDIIQCSNPLTIATTSTPDHCDEGIGTATVTTSGGTGPFTYSWAPSGGSNATATGLPAGTYTVTVNDGLSCTPPLTSTIVVSPTGSTPTVNVPANISVCNGQTVAANTFSSIPAGGTFTWTNSNPAIGLAASGTGSQPSFTATNTGSTTLTATITVTPSIAGGCPGTPNIYTITVLPTPIMSPVTPISVCTGSIIPISAFVSTVTNTTFNWTNTNSSIGLVISGTGNVPSFTSANTSSSAIVGTINVIPNLNNTCYGVPVSYTITVKPTPTITPLSNQAECVGNNVPASTFSSTPAGAIFTWTNSNPAIGLPANGTGDYTSFVGLNPGTTPITSTISVTPTINGCVGPVVTYTITILQSPQMVAPPNVTVCAGTIVPLADLDAQSTPPSGVTFTWSSSNPAIGLPATGTGDIPLFNSTNTTASPILSTITITPGMGNCIGDSVSFVITINPIPTMTQPSNIVVCANNTITVLPFTADPAGSTFTWNNTNTSVGLAASGTSNISSFPGLNFTNSIQNSTVSIIPSFAGCAGQAVSFTITINSLPIAQNVTDVEECAGTLISIIPFSSIPSGANFGWTNSDPSIGLASLGLGNMTGFMGLNSNTTPSIATIQVIPTLNSCIGLPISFTVTINPIPIVFASNNGPICEGNDLNLSVNASTNATYEWVGPNDFTSQLQLPVLVTSTPNESGMYTVIVTQNNCTNSDSTTVLINPILFASINPVGPFCQNEPSLTLSATYPSGIWSGDAVTSTGLFDPNLATIGSNEISFTTVGDCPSTTTGNIIINAVPLVDFFVDTNSGCAPLTVQFTNTSFPVSESVIWNFGDGTTSSSTPVVSHTFTSVGCFDISLQSTTSGCTGMLTQNDFICTLPTAIAAFTAQPDSTTVFSPTFYFTNSSVDATSYIWDFGDGDQSSNENAVHTYPAVPSYYTITLFANNDLGCPDTAYLTVKVKDVLIYFVPNSFTPDHDVFNETFQPVFTSGFIPASYKFYVFDRWGEVVFQTNETNEGWDGKYKGIAAQDDVYTWKIEFKESEAPVQRVVTGHVSLLR